jgi:uncharacterized membrane protein
MRVSDLLAIVFNDQYRASEVLNELERQKCDWVADLEKAVVVRQVDQDKFKVLFSFDPTTEEEESWARLWGSLLSLVLFKSLEDGIVDTARNLVDACGMQTNGELETLKILPDVKWWREILCLSDDFVRDVGAMIQPGDSALFTLLHTDKRETVFQQLRNYGGTLVNTTLSPEQDQQLRDVLAFK